jgi:hypothetical protein
MSTDFHVKHEDGAGWIVKRCLPRKTFGSFRRRALAEAYGRALAHSHRVELIVHMAEGEKIRYPAFKLTYATRL